MIKIIIIFSKILSKNGVGFFYFARKNIEITIKNTYRISSKSAVFFLKF
jgi:hypothetical protein